LDLWDVKRKPPSWANGPPSEAFIISDESSSPSADDPSSFLTLRRTGYIIDADRTTLRLSTGYPMETYI
jgi:hypothetical protein